MQLWGILWNTQVRSQSRLYGIYSGQSCAGTIFSFFFEVFGFPLSVLFYQYSVIFIIFADDSFVEHSQKPYGKTILGNCPTWRTNSFQCIYLLIVLYMFRACHAHHVCLLPTSTRHCHQHGVTITRSCIDTICFSWWWAWHARNM